MRLQGKYPYSEGKDVRRVPVTDPKYNVRQTDVPVRKGTCCVTGDATNPQRVRIKRNEHYYLLHSLKRLKISPKISAEVPISSVNL